MSNFTKKNREVHVQNKTGSPKKEEHERNSRRECEIKCFGRVSIPFYACGIGREIVWLNLI